MLSTTSIHDLDSGVCEITAAGQLDLAGAGLLRTAVLKGLAEQPLALLIDLAAVEVADPVPLLILPALNRRAVADCGLHLRCYVTAQQAAAPFIRRVLGRQVDVYDSRETAMTTGLAESASCRRIHERLAPNEHAPSLARILVAEACDLWGLPDLTEDAQIIVSELVTNVIRHTGRFSDVILLLRRPYLYIQVLDPDPRVPLFPLRTGDALGRADSPRIGGWGLYLVSTLASGCGVALRTPGKIVWATLRAEPVSEWDSRPAAPPAP